VNAKERIFFITPRASGSNSVTYPGKQDSTNLSSGKAENDKRLKSNRICLAQGPVRRPLRAAGACGKALVPVLGTGFFICENREDFCQQLGIHAPEQGQKSPLSRAAARPASADCEAAPVPLRRDVIGVARTIAVRPKRRTLRGQRSIGLDRFRAEAEVLRFMAQVGLAQRADIQRRLGEWVKSTPSRLWRRFGCGVMSSNPVERAST